MMQQLTDQEMNRMCAEKVMGWEVRLGRMDEEYYWDGEKHRGLVGSGFWPIHNPVHNEMLLEKMTNEVTGHGWNFTLSTDTNGWDVHFWMPRYANNREVPPDQKRRINNALAAHVVGVKGEDVIDALDDVMLDRHVYVDANWKKAIVVCALMAIGGL